MAWDDARIGTNNNAIIANVDIINASWFNGEGYSEVKAPTINAMTPMREAINSTISNYAISRFKSKYTKNPATSELMLISWDKYSRGKYFKAMKVASNIKIPITIL